MSIRLRLALWYSAVLGVTLLVFAVGLYFLVLSYLENTADATLAAMASHVVTAMGTAGGDTRQIGVPDIDFFSAPGVHVEFFDANGDTIAHSAGLGSHHIPYDPVPLAELSNRNQVYYSAFSESGERVRVYGIPFPNSRNGEAILIAKSLRDLELTATNLRQMLFGGGVLAMLVAFAGGWAISRRALRPVSSITSAARTIGLSGAFDQRLPPQPGKDEVGELTRAFNEMLASLEHAWETQRRFVDDASHELRAPLTTIRGNLDLLARTGTIPEKERDEVLADLSEEAERMSRLVENLLALARADAGQALSLQPVELDSLLLEVYRQCLPMASGQRFVITSIDQAVVAGDRDRLRQLLLILIDNALKYTPKGGNVALSLARDVEGAVLTVADSGVGIGAKDLPHIFQRFWRADRARMRDGSGAGLGLSIAKWIVERHHGKLTAQSSPGTGSIFTVRLPLRDVQTPPQFHGAREAAEATTAGG